MFKHIRQHLQTGIVEVISEEPENNKVLRTALQINGDVLNFTTGLHVFEDEAFVKAHNEKVDKAYSDSVSGNKLLKVISYSGIAGSFAYNGKTGYDILQIEPSEILSYLSWMDWAMILGFIGSFFLKKILVKIIMLYINRVT